MTHEEILRANRLRNMGPEWVAWYESLPPFSEGMEVRCPRLLPDGKPIADGDIPGCGIYFSDYAADPSHRRRFQGDSDA